MPQVAPNHFRSALPTAMVFRASNLFTCTQSVILLLFGLDETLAIEELQKQIKDKLDRTINKLKKTKQQHSLGTELLIGAGLSLLIGLGAALFVYHRKAK
eukprot:TRINITY_DN7092_c0_g1_i1.p1 TRINITY_DN7092_c0_g1~~TRINITY_DN7092_c0_g1_i1.p1  ORF type:complete len:100 (+),score=15.90 TRINITY_DN7092_c0_g1_i1:98-397(+)